MISKFKAVFRVFFPKKQKDYDKWVNQINSFEIVNNYESVNQHYNIFLKNDLKIQIRNFKHSDLNVFNQIFVSEEYQILISLFKYQFGKKSLNIIDAGANIGLTTLYLCQFIENSNIYCIEPDPENFKLLKNNTNSIIENRVTLYNKALTHNSNLRFQIESSFRDGQDWSKTTNEKSEGEILGITINDILTENEIKVLDVLKIDIEGAERFLFKKENDLSYLKKTNIIAIEIHDEFEIRDEITKALIDNDFFIFETGELTIGINKKTVF